MYLFVPKSQDCYRDFQKTLGTDNWRNWMSKFRKKEGDIVLPHFKVEYETDLLPALVALSGPEFPRGDFLGVGAGLLIISNIIHKTFVEANEEGTEAAAVTAVVMKRALSMQRFSMVVNRPFFCAIQDSGTGAILFMGWVVEPGE